jgi:hypothetical protein
MGQKDARVRVREGAAKAEFGPFLRAFHRSEAVEVTRDA